MPVYRLDSQTRRDLWFALAQLVGAATGVAAAWLFSREILVDYLTGSPQGEILRRTAFAAGAAMTIGVACYALGARGVLWWRHVWREHRLQVFLQTHCSACGAGLTEEEIEFCELRERGQAGPRACGACRAQGRRARPARAFPGSRADGRAKS